MRVPDEVRKTVGFVAFESSQGKGIVPVGTFFFLGHDPSDALPGVSPKVYAVTAAHVVNQLKVNGRSDLTLRMNSAVGSGPTITKTVALADWFIHPTDPTTDVAILEMGVPDAADHLVIPFKMCATAESMKSHEVKLGDGVFISGLFRHHFGSGRNIPIVRTGNLAALNEEKVDTRLGPMDALLIEARSTGGLSGSPVFLNLGEVRLIGGQLKTSSSGSAMYQLLGIVHGHFELKLEKVTSENERDQIERVNAGIAIVTPVDKVLEVIRIKERLGQPA